MIDSCVNGLLSILTTLYNSSTEIAEFLRDNFEFIDVFKMAANASTNNKQNIIKNYMNLTLSPTLDFYDSILSKMNWEYFTEFIRAEDISIVRDTVRFIIKLAEKFPIVLNGAEFEDFVDYELELFDCGVSRKKEIAAEFLTIIIQSDNPKIFEHLMDNELLFKCGDLLENKDEHLILTILKAL